MKTQFGTWLSTLAVCVMALPVQAAETAPARTVADVALTSAGHFQGMVVDEAGKPLANAPVQILHNQKVVATAKTNLSGRYSVHGLRSGMHVVQTKSASQACRFWDNATAPPSAKRGLVMASHQTIVRGQFCDDGCGEGCGEGCGGGGCGLLGGGGLGMGALLPIGAFAAVTAVTLASTRGNSSTAAVVAPPASP